MPTLPTYNKAVYESAVLIKGRYIQIHELFAYFSHITAMLLHYYDTEEYTDCTFILGDYIRHPVEYFRALYPGRKIIAYQLEQLVSGGSHPWHDVLYIMFNLRSMDEIWEFDVANVVFLSWHGIKVTRLVPVRHTPTLRFIQYPHRHDCDIDILFYGFINSRRYRFLERIERCFYNRLKWIHAYGIWGVQLDNLISKSKIILNLHANEPYHRQEQPRIFYPLINCKCVLSEKNQLNWFGDAIIEFTDNDFEQRIEQCLESYQKIGQFGAEIFKDQTSEKNYTASVEYYRSLAK